MIKKCLVSLSFIAAVLAVAVVGTVSAEKLRVGMECTYAPFNFKNANGELMGYDVDVAKGVAGLIGADMEFVCQKWDGMIPALLANKFDLVIASMSITEKRLKKMDFSDTYRISVGRLVGKKNAGWKLFDGTGRPIVANFAGLKVGLERATTYSDWFENELPEATVVLYDSNEALYLDLVNGRTDMIMTNPMKAHLRFLSKEDGAGFEFVSPQIDEKKYFGIGVGIGLRKGNDELKGRLNAALETLTDDGWLEKYALQYFPFAIH
ncbi:MAG TPA: transporter substrate-binding domain-containing protein [Candidatus Marinimicrobia bacterium]|nr:transporter substrate-binding domain-containing protein [Candidatus Neomarinimicrobiota bacterium]